MGLTSSIDSTEGAPPCTLCDEERTMLLGVARDAIAYGLERETILEVDLERYTAQLVIAKGCFVTLFLEDELRGCVGCLRARAPLVQEVSRAAYSAAFRDPRFAPVSRDEAGELRIHVSVLSEPVEVRFENEHDLMAMLRPGVDGVILAEGSKLGTFLPEVWEKFPEPEEFMRQLRVKAGLPPSYWSDTLRVERYTTEAFG